MRGHSFAKQKRAHPRAAGAMYRCCALFLVVASASAYQASPVLARGRTAVTSVQAPALVARPAPIACSAALPVVAEEPASPQPRLGRARKVASALALSLAVPALALASGSGEHLHLGQKVALFFSGTGLPDWAVLMLISMIPAVELRGGVPVGNWMGLSPWVTLIICIIGNMVPIAPTILALRSDFVKKIAAPLLTRAEKKLAGLPTGQSRTLALALFVGIPAPGTGAWTGAIIAYLLDMPFATAMGAIFSVPRLSRAPVLARSRVCSRASPRGLPISGHNCTPSTMLSLH